MAHWTNKKTNKLVQSTTAQEKQISLIFYLREKITLNSSECKTKQNKKTSRGKQIHVIDQIRELFLVNRMSLNDHDEARGSDGVCKKSVEVTTALINKNMEIIAEKKNIVNWKTHMW